MRTSDRSRRAALLLVLLAAGRAAASKPFPEAITQHLALTYLPQCSLCHNDGNTGPGTARTPFAYSMRARGLTSGDRQLVPPALDLMSQDAVDSDGDGVTDIAELLAGTDPNVYGPVPIPRQDPSWGCSAVEPDLLPIAALAAFCGLRRTRPRRGR